ncbi:MAG: PilZ domain-containing protein [Deltaproteobacteria bacterium]|nr:PilZ domain-containing protein [Deltaproteobacteria bacterium]
MTHALKKIPLFQNVKEKRFNSLATSNIRLTVQNSDCRIHNISDSGAAFWCKQDFHEQLETVFSLSLSEESPLELKGRILWKRKEDQGFLYGFHFNSQYLPEGFLEAIDKLDFVKEKLNQDLKSYDLVSNDFKILTFEIKNFLGSIKQTLDQLESEIRVCSEGTRNSYKEVLKAKLEPDFVSTLKKFSKRLDLIFSQVTEKELRKNYIHFFRNEVGAYYTQNPFIGRALRKPLGYAGDFEMMNQIYRDSYEGNSFFEILMHRYGINESSSLSVKFRKKYLSDKILSLSKEKSQFTFGSIASGPAHEILQFLDQVPVNESEKYRIVLVDQDVEALLNSKRSIYDKIISRNLKCKTFFLPISVKHILESTEETQLFKEFKFDLLYSAGLYDYLTQPVAQILTYHLSLSLKQEGTMIIGNFHPNNPTKTISELVADWRLIHRSEDEMIQLTQLLNFKEYRLHKDDQEIDLFLEVTMK